MSNQFLKLRRSSIPGKVPTTSSLEFGEIALNTYDGLAFIKKSGSSGEEIITIGATSGNFTGSLFGTASWALQALTSSYSLNIDGEQYYVAIFDGNNSVTSSLIYQSQSFTGIRATTPTDPTNPDILFVDGTGIDTYNLISAHADRNNYVQTNVQNFNNSTIASSDVVATADNGTESTNYIDMGINSSGYDISVGVVGGANDAYLYSTGNDLLIGNATPNKKVIIFNGGLDTEANARVYVHEQGTVGINTSTYNSLFPPALEVQAVNSTTTKIINASANVDDFVENTIVNANAGTSASADFVAYNDLDPGNQEAGYVNLGINSTNYIRTVDYPGAAGDAYVFTDSNHLILGPMSQSAESRVTIFAGGISEIDNAKLVLYSNNRHQMTGSLNASQGFTGSLFGTASWARNALTASFVPTSSLSGNFFAQGGNSFGTQALLGTNDNQNLAFETSGSVRMFISSSGNVGIGTNSSTDTLTVSGSTLLKGSGNTSTTNALSAQNSEGTNLFRIRNDSSLLFGSSSTGPIIFPSDVNGLITSSGENLTFSTSVSTQNYGFGAFHFRGGALTSTSGNNAMLSIARSFSPSSGNANMYYLLLGPLINQTGGANGITRGIFVAPTLTSAFDWRSIEWSNNTGWGLYGAGTALNYLNGSLLISTTTDSGFKLDVNGSGRFTNSLQVTGSLNAPVITGSLFGTASWARNALTASSADNFVIRQNITGSNALFTGTVTAQTLVVQTITSSVDFVTGSTRFGSLLTDTHQFTGSVSITGSLNVNGGAVPLGSGTAGQVTVWSAASQLSGSNNLFWNTALNRLGIGTSSPSRTLHLSSSNSVIRLDSTTAFSGIQNVTPQGNFYVALDSNTSPSFGVGANAAVLWSDVAAPMVFGTTNLERARISSTGEFGIGLTSPTARLHVSASSGVLFEVDSNTVSNILYVTSSGQVGISRSNPQYPLDVSGSARIGASTDTTTQGELLRLSVGSSAGASSYIGFQRANPTYASYNIGYPGSSFFGFFRTGETIPLFGFSPSTTQLVSANFGLSNGTVNIQTSFYFSSSSQYTAPIRIANSTTSPFGTYLPFISINTTGTEYEYAKITGIKPATFAGSAVVGGLQFSIKSGSDSWINPFDITFDSRFLMTGSLNVSGSSHSVIGPTTINNLTGSLFGTASWALNALTASFVPSTAIVGDISRIATGSVTASVGIGTSSFQLTSGSSTFLFVSNSGNVGIGIATPQTILDISGSNPTVKVQVVNNSETATLSLAANDGGIRGGIIANISTGEIRMGGLRSSGYFPTFYSNNVERMRIGVNGNVGIGTTTPSASLHISGSTGILLEVDSNTQNNILYVTSSGNVGIGWATTGSLYRLDISGSARVTDQLYIESASLDYQQNLSVQTGSWQNIVAAATGSYKAAFFDYAMFSGSIGRAGTVTTFWSASATEFYENYTEDLGGSTAGVVLQTAISSSQIVLQATASSAAWTIRSLVRLL